MTSQTTAEYAVAAAQPNLAADPGSPSRFAGYGEGSQLDLDELSDRAPRQVCARCFGGSSGTGPTPLNSYEPIPRVSQKTHLYHY